MEPLLLEARPGAADVRDRLVVVIVVLLLVVQAAHDLLEPEPRRGEGLLGKSAVIVFRVGEQILAGEVAGTHDEEEEVDQLEPCILDKCGAWK